MLAKRKEVFDRAEEDVQEMKATVNIRERELEMLMRDTTKVKHGAEHH